MLAPICRVPTLTLHRPENVVNHSEPRPGRGTVPTRSRYPRDRADAVREHRVARLVRPSYKTFETSSHASLMRHVYVLMLFSVDQSVPMSLTFRPLSAPRGHDTDSMRNTGTPARHGARRRPARLLHKRLCPKKAAFGSRGTRQFLSERHRVHPRHLADQVPDATSSVPPPISSSMPSRQSRSTTYSPM